MARSLFRQATQIRTSRVYDDTLSLSLAETSTSLEQDLNYLRSALKDIKGTANWYDGSPETLTDLAARPFLTDKKILYSKQHLADVTVPSGQNYVVLGAGQFPAEVKAINSSTEGAVVSQLPGSVGSHSTLTVTGDKNVLLIRDASTHQVIQDTSSPPRDLLGLLQVGSTATDGTAFSASGSQRAQISFVTLNPATEAYEAASIASIQTRVVEYVYRVRSNLSAIPEEAFTGFSSGVPVTLESAYSGGATVQVDTTDVLWKLTDGRSFRITDSGSVDILKVLADSLGDTLEVTANSITITNVDPVEITGSLEVDTSGTPLTLESGQVSATTLSVSATGGTLQLQGSGDASLISTGGELYLDDVRTAAIPLSDPSNTTLFGGATSILGAIVAAASGLTLVVGRVSVNPGGILANTTLTAANTTQVIDAPNALVSYTDADEFTDNLLIFLNGVLQNPGVSGASNLDVYPAGIAANGEMAFEVDLDEGEVITIVKLV